MKVFKTTQHTGKKLKLNELVTDDETRGDDSHWDGGEAPETEVEWMLFQKRPPTKPGEDKIEGFDDLPNGDEMVTRRYEFYEYIGDLDPEDGEAKCSNPDRCPEAIGRYIGAQMAGFNVEAPLGLIDHLQDAIFFAPYIDRIVVVGGNTPYDVTITNGALPPGMSISTNGVLSGAPTELGEFAFSVTATDADDVTVSKALSLKVISQLGVLTSVPDVASEGEAYSFTLTGTGGVPPYSWTADALPEGLSLSAEGLVAGTPPPGSAGDFWSTITVIDSEGRSSSSDLLFIVKSAPELSVTLSGSLITVGWPLEAAGWKLQSTMSLTQPDWQDVPGVVGNSATLNASEAALFLRLTK